MDAEWDEKKSEANRRKHGVSFEEAVSVLLDRSRLTERVGALSSTRREEIAAGLQLVLGPPTPDSP